MSLQEQKHLRHFIQRQTDGTIERQAMRQYLYNQEIMLKMCFSLDGPKETQGFWVLNPNTNGLESVQGSSWAEAEESLAHMMGV